MALVKANQPYLGYKMAGYGVLLVFLGVFAGEVFGDLCLYKTPGSYYSSVRYCEDGCCGYYYDLECCDDIGGVIAGAVVGGILFIAAIVTIILLCKYCNRTRTGTIVAPAQQTGGQITGVNTHQSAVQQPYGTIPQPYGAYPQPNAHPAAPYPPPPVAYPGQPVYPPPTQTY